MCLEELNSDKFLLHKYYIFVAEILDNRNKPKVDYEDKTSVTHLPQITLLTSLSLPPPPTPRIIIVTLFFT